MKGTSPLEGYLAIRHRRTDWVIHRRIAIRFTATLSVHFRAIALATTLARRRSDGVILWILEARVFADKAQSDIAYRTITMLGYDNLRHATQVVTIG